MGPVGVEAGIGVVVLVVRTDIVVLIGRTDVVELEAPDRLLGEEEPDNVLEPVLTVAETVELELEELEELEQGIESHPGVYLVVS